MTTLPNVFSNEDFEYLISLPEVVSAKEKLDTSSNVYFSIPLTETIRCVLNARLGLNLSGIEEIPMRWIKGDTAPHIDSGKSQFENTYLVYLNDSPGNFILEKNSYSITSNTAFVFNEGLIHKTENTGLVPRLLLGPMNEFAESVGEQPTILYFDNYTNAVDHLNAIASQTNNWIIGSIESYTSWRVAEPGGYPGVYLNGHNFGTHNGITFYLYPSVPCFLEGTKVLCEIDGSEQYVPIETIKVGTLVKTSRDGFQKVKLIGKGDIVNPGNDTRIENRLYKCSPAKYPELKEDLFLTGGHAILKSSITDLQREKITKHLGKIFVTDKKNRLMACLDDLAEPWGEATRYTIWHVALEHINEKMNYGIYVNGGLLVESCFINYLKNKSNMTIV